MIKFYYYALLFSICFYGLNVYGQYQINDFNTTQTIDFDGFEADGFSPTPSATQLSSNDWEVLGLTTALNFGDTETGGSFARGTSSGGVTSGGIYSFDVGVGNSYTLGVQPTGGDFSPGSFTLRIQNNTGGIIEDLELSYDIFVYNDQDRANSFDFEHSSDNVTFTQEPSLDFTSPGPEDPSPEWEANNRNITLNGLNIGDGDFYYLKWTSDDVSGSGGRDEFALDNIEITVTEVATPTLAVSTNSITNFSQAVGSPSPEEVLNVSGSNLSDDITITVTSGDYEISETSGSGFGNAVTLQQSGGGVAGTNIYIRLNGPAPANPSNGELEVTSGAITELVNLEGVIFIPSYIVDFEGTNETKTSYALDTVNLSGLDWRMENALIGTLANDFKNGIRSARFLGQNGAFAEMIEDKADGIGEISFEYSIYGSDSDQQPWDIDYSLDGGNTWENIGTVTADATVQTFNETVQEGGDVRIRVVLATSPGASGNRRMNIDDIVITDYIPDPEITVTPTQLTGFLQTVGTPSGEQSFEVEGDFLDDDILVEVTNGEYEISENIGGPWGSSITLTESNGQVSNTTLYVRLNGSAPSNPENGDITISTPGATNETVQLEGIIQAAGSPTINLSTSSLTGFQQILGSPSAEQTFEVSAEDLIDDLDLDLTGTDFEISTTSGSGFDQTITLTPSAGEISSTTIYVRLNGGVPNANVTDQVSVSSQDAVSQTINLTGEILQTPEITTTTTTLTGFFQITGTPSVALDFEVEGENLIDDIDIEVTSGDYEIATSASGPWSSTNLTLSQSNGEVSLTEIYVRLNGTTAQNPAEGELTLTSQDAITVVIDLSGEIQEANDPVISASPLLLSGFVQELGTPSSEQTFEVEGTDLNSDIELTANNGYEISTDAGGPYQTAITLPEAGGEVSLTTIYVRLNGANVADPVNGEVEITSIGVQNNLTVELEGEIIEGCNLDTDVSLDGATLTASQGTGVDYQWVDCNNNFDWVPGANDQVFEPEVNGSYAVILTADDDVTCVDTSACVEVTTVSVTALENNEIIEVFPNPVNDKLQIISENNIESITVFTVEGQLIFNKERANTSSETIYTDNWVNGVYQVIIKTQNNLFTKKVVKN